MIKINLLALGTSLVFLIFGGAQSNAQSHWESVILSDQLWKYLPAISEPDREWNQLAFNDDSWQEGSGGIGYGDNDDATLIEAVNSLYLRKSFQVDSISAFGKIYLDIDYDDAFVAYLNGQEVARSTNISDAPPAYNSPLSYLREAEMYRGGLPDRYQIDTSYLEVGENLLAIQIINSGPESSDMTSIVFLNAEIISDQMLYYDTPDWFIEPIGAFEGKLPLIFINTEGQNIVDDPRIIAQMGIVNKGPGKLNSQNDPYTEYNGRISIEVRGQSSQMFPKKSYAIETQDSTGENLNVSLLGMPKENDWILYAPYSDKSMLRNSVTFLLGQKMDSYCSRIAYCELYIDEEYQGIYILMEKIKRDEDRVDIATLLPTDLEGDELTGGYIFKVDKIDSDYSEGFSGFTSSPNPSYPNAMDIIYQYYDPKPADLALEQRNYLKDAIIEAEAKLIAGNFGDPENGYNSYLNTGSFVDFMIINEISKEVDKYRYSNYMYKKKDSKGGEIFAGPIWDFNLGYGNVDYWSDGLYTRDWLFEDVNPNSWSIMFWWDRLMTDPYFKDLATTRWEYMRSNDFSNNNLIIIIDSLTNYIDDAQVRNYKRWPILGQYVWPNYDWQNNTYEDEVDYFRFWLISRVAWMDQNLNGKILEPVVTIDLLSRTNNRLEYSLTLSDDQFNHTKLKSKYFTLESDDDYLEIDSVHYISSTSAKVVILRVGEGSFPDSEFSLVVDDKILNGFRPLESDKKAVNLQDYFVPASSEIAVYASHRRIYIKTTIPSSLPEQMMLYNGIGQVVGRYQLAPDYLNIVHVNLPTDIYYVKLINDTGVVSRKILISE